MEEKVIKEGDLVAITPKAMNDMINHCNKAEIPAHNHGKVLSVVTPLQKDGKGRYLHPYPHNVELGKYNYVTVQFPDEVIGFVTRDLMLLY